MSVKVCESKDSEGCRIKHLVDIDGFKLPQFQFTAEKATEIMRGVANIPVLDDDVMLYTYPKSGTHWSFEILLMLLQGSSKRVPTKKIDGMIETKLLSEIEEIPSPRILNSHLPFELLPKQLKEKRTKMLVVLRNPKDLAVSFYHHISGMKMFQYDGKFGEFLVDFMEGNVPYGDWFEETLKLEKALENGELNMHLTYFEDLKTNGVAEIKKIADFLEVEANVELCEAINDMCAFDKMAVEKATPKAHLDRMCRNGFSLYRKGIIGDWKNNFTVAQSEAFDNVFAEKMKSSKLKFRYE